MWATSEGETGTRVWGYQFLCCYCSAAKSCLTLYDPMDCSTSASLFFTISRSLLRFMFIESVMLSNHLILCHPLLLPPSIFPSIGVFSNGLALRIRWLKYWSFSFSISPSNEYSGLISFGIDWLGLGPIWFSLIYLTSSGYVILLRVMPCPLPSCFNFTLCHQVSQKDFRDL